MADHPGDTISVDWSTAQVEDRELRVALLGEPHKGWRQHFRTTAKLLGDGRWGELSLKKGHLRVEDVTEGSEQDLRHHLESIVAQANAAVAADSDRDPAETEPGPAAENDLDTRMTAQFRSFAESPAGAVAEDGGRAAGAGGAATGA